MKYWEKFGFYLLMVVITLCCVSNSFGQSKSRVVGTIRDASTGEVLIGANVILIGTHLGGSTDINGKYFIVAVPVGTYKVKASMMGYREAIVTDAVVSADRVTTVDFKLQSGDIQLGAVVVTANQDQLHKEVSNTQVVVNSRQIVEAAGIREINTLLTQQPGVAETNGYLTIRGGSADQVGTMVNGISYNNAATGNAETSVPLSSIDQVSVLAGGYNAEYGNFRSGLINVTTKSGTKDGYHATANFQRDFAHMKRFGTSFYDAKSPILTPYLDASVAFSGDTAGWTDNPYNGEKFVGWKRAAQLYNATLSSDQQQATPLDMYLLSAWMFTTEPDYEGLAKLGYTVSDEQKRLFHEHKMKEGDGVDKNFDGGFGGPLPLIGNALGDATFYISNNSQENFYVMPMTLPSEKKYTTLATIRMEPSKSTTLSLTGLWKVQQGVSRMRPAFTDQYPDASRNGGFMPIDNTGEFTNTDPMYWFDAAFYPILTQATLIGGITLNHVINQSTFYELSINYSNIQDHSPTGDNRDTSLITSFGPFSVDEMPYGKWQFAGSHRVGDYKYASYDLLPGNLLPYRFRGKEGDLYDNSNTTQWRAKFDITSQVDEHNYVKGGIEFNDIILDNKYWLKWNSNAYNAFEFNYNRTPSQTGLYVQDQVTYQGIIANLGVRGDYYFGGGGLWPSGDPWAVGAFAPLSNYGSDTALFNYLANGGSYIWDAWQKYDSAHPGFLQPIKNYFTISPRIGVSFPVTENSKFYFNYGHFRSNPPYYSMYLIQYRYIKNGLYYMSNPNLEPPRTVQYEIGMALDFLDSYNLRLSGYYKDITGQNGRIDYVGAPATGTQTASLSYSGWANNNYQDIEGLEMNLTKQDRSWLTGTLNFNYRLSKSGLTGLQEIDQVPINDLESGMYQGQETRALPQPELNLTVTFSMPPAEGSQSFPGNLLGDWQLTLFSRWKAGNYVSTSTSSGFNPLGDAHITPFLQWPNYFMLDMKLNKSFSIAGVKTTFYVDVNNVLNIKVNQMSNGNCFADQSDLIAYLASLHLPVYDSPDYEKLRKQSNYTLYMPGNDEVGDLRSDGKSYINDPNYSYWIYGAPREVWTGVRLEF
jgi:outer membrane receptor protein involved in Fe transport